MPPPIPSLPRNAMIDENGRIVMPGQFDPMKTRARAISPRERFALTGRIDARPQNPRYMAGLSNFYALQNRGIPAFADARRPGMSAGEIAEDAERMGYRIGAQGLAPSREQNIAAAKAAGTFEEIRQKYNRENPDKVMDDAGNIKAADKTKAGGVAAPAPAATVTPSPAVETPAMRRQMLRDAATGRSETRDSSGRLTGIQSKYGTGSIKFLKPGEARPVSMTTDEFGKPETMKSYLARRRFIQGTKGFADPNPPANAPSASTPSASTPSASTPSASTPSSSFSKMSDEEGEAEKWAKETYKDINSWPTEKIYSEWTRVNSLEEQRKAESSADQRKRDKALEILEKARNRVNEAAKKDTSKADRPVSMTTDEFGKPETMKSFLARRKAIQASKGFV